MPLPDRQTGFRVYEIMNMIQAGQFPDARAIALRLECSVRTAERYIERIRRLVADELVFDRKRRGYRFTSGGPKLPTFRLTEGEAVAVFLAARLLEQCRGTPYEGAVARAMTKLAYLFPKEITLDRVPHPAGWVTFRMEPLRGEERQVMDVFLRLDQAREKQETVHVRYFTASRDEWNERDIDPYHLHFHDGAWYVFAYCHWRREVKIFALDRMGVIAATGRRFEVPADFSPETFMADSFRIERGAPVDVAIRFGPEQARYVRGKQWHPSQRIEELGQSRADGEAERGEGGGATREGEHEARSGKARSDGGLILRMRVGGLGEVKRWVLSFGAGAQVLVPEELREMVGEEVARMGGLYQAISSDERDPVARP